MATSIGQYTPVFLPREFLALTEKSGRPHSIGSQSDTPKATLCIDTRLFFACGSSAPVRVEGKGSVVAWVMGALEVPNVQGHGLPPLQDLWPYQSLFASLL